MRAAKLNTKEPSGSKASSSSIESLRDYYHSIHDEERVEVIELLGAMEEPEASRELIRLYEECEWRGTRFKIIQALERNPTQRGLEFLFRLAQKQDDISVAEAAIRSLGQTHHRLAALFLINYYPRCPEVLKPALVGALGQIPDRTLAPEFLAELPKAVQAQQILLVKNLVVALGELKVLEALPLLRSIALQKKHPTNALCALVAIGKISRDAKALEGLENRFRDDLFEYQIFSGVKAQIQFRSEWKLEDYLSRIFESDKIHPTLPYELTHFLETDVKEGLKLFPGEKYFEKLCFALSRIDFPKSVTWYEELIDFKKLTSPQRRLVFNSLSEHRNSMLSLPLSILKEAEGGSSTEWLEAAILCLPEAEKELKVYFESPLYRGLPDFDKVKAINSLNNYALVVQANAEKLQHVSRILENLLETETSLSVQARSIRALGYLGINSKRAVNFIKDFLGEVSKGGELSAEPTINLVGSILKYLELCPEKSCTGVLMTLLDLVSLPTVSISLKVALIKAFTSLPSIPDANLKKIESFLKTALESFPSEEAFAIAALNLLKVRPLGSLMNYVIACLKGSSRVQLAAIIALKYYPSE
ncbi:MAG: HEAT repeat domain-containing protein, partial [Bdellovibrionia bacterium]